MIDCRMFELNLGLRLWAPLASVHSLAGRTEVARASEVLDLLDGRPVLGTGTADRLLVRHACVSARVVMKLGILELGE